MTSGKKPEQETINLQIQLDEDTAQGSYANLVMLNHTETEFVFDFIYVQPQQPKAKVRSRIICSPRHTKQFLRALKENLKVYESRFGKIDPPKESPGGMMH